MRQNDSMDAFQQQISPEAKASRIAAVKRRSTGKPARPMAVNANSDGSALPSALLVGTWVCMHAMNVANVHS